MKKGLLHEFTKGIIKENPVLRLMLGACATLAVTTAASNAVEHANHVTSFPKARIAIL